MAPNRGQSVLVVWRRDAAVVAGGRVGATLPSSVSQKHNVLVVQTGQFRYIIPVYIFRKVANNFRRKSQALSFFHLTKVFLRLRHFINIYST